MNFREAVPEDITQIQVVRNSVKENILSDPSKVTDQDCKDFLFTRGKGWVCEISNNIVGFSIVDLKDNNVWALFLLPDFEGQGIGKKLHEIMLDWYFDQEKEFIWLSTTPNTRAEQFYRKAGWKDAGMLPNGELKFEMTSVDWQQLKG